jgi:hypothetical protein
MVVTLKSTRSSAVDTLVEESLRGSREARLNEMDASRKPQNELRKVTHIDYVRVIRRTLDYRALLSFPF